MRIVRGITVALGVMAVSVLGFPAIANSAPAPTFFYRITVTPTTQLPGHTVTVTGTGEHTTPPYEGDNCDDTTILVTITYYKATGAKAHQTTNLGKTTGDGNISGPVTIPSAAAPTSVSGHDAVIVAFCTINETTFTSNQVTVVVEGTAAPPTTTTTTTTTTVPATTTTTTAPATTTTTVPATVAPAATAVSASPTFTG